LETAGYVMDSESAAFWTLRCCATTKKHLRRRNLMRPSIVLLCITVRYTWAVKISFYITFWWPIVSDIEQSKTHFISFLRLADY